MTKEKIIVLVGFVLAVLYILVDLLKRKSPKPLPPSRDIIHRKDVPDGELVELECGHQVHLIRHEIRSINCPQCGYEEAARGK